ncbi:protein NPC2 homolog [Pseudomyrmex gracilis]|uniref:protein NPC2 homolog n=1 Tax=Pseudomyrmex gracilis TaxID=219809 RepID=UPI00099590C6|nr:protein NPC2 homolog [Pseudomyrmex gracilis]
MTRVTNITFAFLYVLCFTAQSFAIYFEDCGSSLGKFTEVSVSKCRDSDPKCFLIRGTNASISIKFVPNQDISNVKVRVTGIVFDVPVPFPLDPKKTDACKDPDSNIDCPLRKNQEYRYTTTMFVHKNFPSVAVDIKWEFLNENNKNIVCIKFPARIKLSERFVRHYFGKCYNNKHNVDARKIFSPISVQRT